VNVFISYRRNQSEDLTGRVFDELKRRFGEENVFFDIISINGGEEWRVTLDRRIAQSKVMLVMLCQEWLEELEKRAEREDLVKHEVCFALKNGIPLIPVLLGPARMPGRASLPGDLKRLADFQYVPVRSGKDFARDIDDLTNAISAIGGKKSSKPNHRARWIATGAAAMLTLFAGMAMLPKEGGSSTSVDRPERTGSAYSTFTLNLPDGGELKISIPAILKAGERAELHLTPDHDVFIRVMHQSSDGYITELLPDRNANEWLIKQGRTEIVSWETSPPAGAEELVVYASPAPLNLSNRITRSVTTGEFFDTRGIPSAIRISSIEAPGKDARPIVEGRLGYLLSD
jgi:hypothetical protein